MKVNEYISIGSTQYGKNMGKTVWATLEHFEYKV